MNGHKKGRARLSGSEIGNTPVVEIPMSITGGQTVFAKLEKYNPYSSVKDRVAWYMIDGAERRGQLLPGGTVVEATSGNTGIALAGFAAVRGYRCIIVMPDSASKERIALLHYLGAEVTLTPSENGYVAAIAKAQSLCAGIQGAWFACQHENADNIAAHYETTGPELWDDMRGRIDVLVCGVGTGGTLTGVARFLKEKQPNLRVVAVEPQKSAVLSGNQGGVHKIYGLNGGFVAPTTDRTVIDEIIQVSDEEAWTTTRALTKAGILVGVSSGAVAFGASQLSKREEYKGQLVATIFPDSGERYVSVLTQ